MAYSGRSGQVNEMCWNKMVIAGLAVLSSSCGMLAIQRGWSEVTFDRELPRRLDTLWTGDDETGEGVTLVRAYVEDMPVWMLLDTGSQAVILDNDLVEKLSLKSRGSLRIGEWLN
jgi:hypothetical protein